jgi:hypothetical protein
LPYKVRFLQANAAMPIEVHEQRCPFWALAAPAVYLLAALLAVRAVLVDRADVGISALLLAAGLFPAFVVPAVFVTCRAKLALTDAGLTINGRPVKVDDARLERAERGSGVLHFVIRNGRTRTFRASSYAEAQAFVARMPPVSAPAGALIA